MRNNHYAGIDVGTSYIKTVILNGTSEITGMAIERTGSDLKTSITASFTRALNDAKVSQSDLTRITATGFGRNNISHTDSKKTEISCHAKGAYHYFPKQITVIDIGGQDTKIIKLDKHGKIMNFKMNRKCAAGTGAFLEEIAYKLNIPLNKMNSLATQSKNEAALNSFCTVFASTEILTRIKEGEKTEDMVKGVFESVVRRIIEMDTLGGMVVLTGGVIAYNKIITTIFKKQVGGEILLPSNPQYIGAVGAALFAKELAKD